MDDDTTFVESYSHSTQGPADAQPKAFKSPFKSPFAGSSTPKSGHGKVRKAAIEDVALDKQSTLLRNELNKQIRYYSKSVGELKQAIRLLEKYETELKTARLVEKWRSVCQGAISYLFNSTLLKVDKLGGYGELRRKEIEAEKRQIEYQTDDGLQDGFDEVLESDEFKALARDEQQAIRDQMDEKLKETETWKEKQFAKLDKELEECSHKEMTIEELARRLKVDYKFVFPS